METDKEIYFYSLKNKYGYMSNFFNTPFKDFDNNDFTSSEQYFMYQKCKEFDPNNKELLENILKENDPAKIKIYGREVKHYNEDVWDKKRYNIMLDGLKLKFTQNKVIKDELIRTKPKLLYEASQKDKIWGIGYYANDAIHLDNNKFGRNLLGKALMELRSIL